MTSILGDLKNPRLIWLKGGLFLFAGSAASFGILLESPDWRIPLLHAIAVWCFARAYYFAFYVIEHYIDSTYRYAGLWDFARYAFSRRSKQPRETVTGETSMKTGQGISPCPDERPDTDNRD
ncbi:MAG TPA: hypothetical protein VM510_16735 [Caulifigura sp.]|nr:hypothetical protein [Caulifigura sp.]